ncbi:hypothetical protein BDM02DRAFT_3257873 [Thelephora ganbajun]|uniref:Uncharacterized protein n=1 Tax=Thelephora ganbajun TaxID=370292 RepID=A0ACB6ZV20_THEGA|nr:hypothetical protein BDM02DRAFT_3257873 [Thelephora ganbajun]
MHPVARAGTRQYPSGRLAILLMLHYEKNQGSAWKSVCSTAFRQAPADKSPHGYNRWLRLGLASGVGFTVSGGPTPRKGLEILARSSGPGPVVLASRVGGGFHGGVKIARAVIVPDRGARSFCPLGIYLDVLGGNPGFQSNALLYFLC